jgi:hypothetical protein
MGHALMENRNGLIVAAVAMRASGHVERLAAPALSEPDASQPQPISFGADKGYDAREFVCHGVAQESGHPACREKYQ